MNNTPKKKDWKKEKRGKKLVHLVNPLVGERTLEIQRVIFAKEGKSHWGDKYCPDWGQKKSVLGRGEETDSARLKKEKRKTREKVLKNEGCEKKETVKKGKTKGGESFQ